MLHWFCFSFFQTEFFLPYFSFYFDSFSFSFFLLLEKPKFSIFMWFVYRCTPFYPKNWEKLVFLLLLINFSFPLNYRNIFLYIFYSERTDCKVHIQCSERQNIHTKHSQIMCLINTYILVYQHNCYGCKLWNAPWFCCIFSKEFSYIIDEYSCPKYFIFTKFSQIVCLINVHILVCQYFKWDCKL